MAESIVQVTEGSGKKLHTFARTIGANTVEDEVVLNGEPYLATYTIAPAAVSLATLNDHLLQIMAGSTLNVYLHAIRVTQVALATAATIGRVHLYRLTTAGTGGTAVTPTPHDTTDAASGATAMTLPTAKGTEGSRLLDRSFQTIQTLGTGGAGYNTVMLDMQWDGIRAKMPRIAAGVNNGLALKSVVAIAGASVVVEATILEANF